jgi:predicted permease
MVALGRDVRSALRLLRFSPGFALTVVLSIGVGIGANTTVFAWLDNIVRRPFPGLPNGESLVAVNVAEASGRVEGMPPIAYSTLQDWVGRTSVFDTVAAHAPVRLNLRATKGEAGAPVWAEITSAGFFETVGAKPFQGRFYSAEDETTRAPLVVLSHAFWSSRFGGASSVVGRSVLFNGVPLTVIGVAPPRFGGVVTGLAFEAWLPIWLQPDLMPGSDWMRDRGARRMQAVARLRPGMTLARARAELNAVARQVSEAQGDVPVSGAGVRWVTDTQLGSLVGPLGTALMAVTAAVLIAVSANIAGLLLARGVSRRRQTATQVAIGATRWHLIREAIVHAAVLASLGCIAGLWIAFATKDVLLAFVPRVSLPVGLEVDLNWRVVLFAAALAVASVLLSALVPAIRGSHPDVMEALKSSSCTGRRARLRHALVVVQVAVSVMALSTASLFLQSVASAGRVPLGLADPSQVLLVSTDLSFTRHSAQPLTALVDLALERIRGLPGIGDAALASFVPLSFGGPPGVNTRVEGYAPGPEEAMFVDRATITDRYFETLGIALVEGRRVLATDRADTPRVVVVNEAFVARYWPGRSGLGRRIDQGDGWAVVAGVVRDSAVDTLTEGPRPLVYHPWTQAPTNALTLHVRTTAVDPLALIEPVRSALASVHADLPALDPGTLADHMRAAVFVQSVGASAFTAFGLIAILVATIGLYGVVAQHLAERRRDVAIMAALGASPRTIAGSVARPALGLTVAGLAAGAGPAVAAGMLVRGQLILVDALDPISMGGSVVTLAVTAVASCAWPVWMAIGTDPRAAMRVE